MRLALPGIVAAVVLLTACGNPSPPGETGEEVRHRVDPVMEYLAHDARRITDRAVEELSSRETWEALREQRRREMLDTLGLDPLPERTDLRVEITGAVEREEFRVERIAFQSLPQVYVTANLYIPRGSGERLPAVIYVCGHAFSEHGNKTSYQRHPITLARHGYVCMILDSIQVSETFALHHGVLNNELYDWYSRGYTPAGVEVWNVIRALDYLSARSDVDPARFGMTGRSGGAAMSWFAAAVDDRIKVVAPIMGNSTYAANLKENTQRLHCDCMFAINSHRHDLMHQGALISPRPLLMAHGLRDDLFPRPGFEEFERTVGVLYESYGVPERFVNLVVDSGHADSDYLRAEVVRWFDRWLKEIPEREIDVEVEEIPAEELSVFQGTPPPDAANYLVHKTFVREAELQEPMNASEWARRRALLLERLKQRVFAAFPDDPPEVVFKSEEPLMPNGFIPLTLETDPGVSIRAYWREARKDDSPSLLYVASARENLSAILDTIRQTAGSDRNPILIVYPRGEGVEPWNKKHWKDVLRNAMQVGRSVDSMRLWDVLQSASFLHVRVPSEIVTAGIGVSGILGMYAAVLNDRITQSILIDPPVTHRQGPVFLDILRFTDLPEVAALLAPRRLTFFGRVPAEYRSTERIFGILGCGDRFSRTLSIDAALNGVHHHDFASGL